MKKGTTQQIMDIHTNILRYMFQHNQYQTNTIKQTNQSEMQQESKAITQTYLDFQEGQQVGSYNDIKAEAKQLLEQNNIASVDWNSLKGDAEGAETGEELLPFGVAGGTSEDITEPYKNIKGPGVEEDAMYLIKANAPINTEAHTYVQTQLYSGKIKFLIDEGQAKLKLMATKVGQNMDADKRAEYLMPFTLTTILREQMLNLVEENEGVNIILKQSSRSTPKDKFSAFEYGLYYIKQEEDKKKKRKKRNIADMMFFTNK